MTPEILALLTFLSLAVVAGGIAWLAKNWNAPMLARLRALNQPLGAAGGNVTVLAEDRPKNPVEKLLTKLGRRTERPANADADDLPALVRKNPDAAPDLAAQLTHAGFRRPHAMALLMGVRLAAAGTMTVIGFGLATFVSPKLLPTCFALGLLGYVLPRFLVARIAAKRREEIQRSLPDAMDLLLLCVEAGLGLNAALVKVAEERSNSGEDPIGLELTQLAKELQMGVGRREAFRNLADRTGVAELRSLAAHLIQSERFGSSIANTLRVQSESMRTHRRLQAEEIANKTQVKLLFPLILFIFPSVMIVILMPAVMRLMDALKVLV
jgi:tight adherence protein C